MSVDRAKKAAIKEIKPVNCPTSRRTAVGACGTAFQLGGVVHSCKWLDDHEGAHYCDCVAEGSHFPVEDTGLLEAAKAFHVIAVALAEPAGGEYWSARELATKWGIYNEDLDGERILLRIAEEAEKRLRFEIAERTAPPVEEAGWVSIRDRMPSGNARSIVTMQIPLRHGHANHNPRARVAYWTGKSIKSSPRKTVTHVVTHWKEIEPLPAPPVEREEK